MENDIKYMKMAIEEGKKAYEAGELPVGAVLVKENKVIKGRNKKEEKQQIISHAEIEAISKASKEENNWRLLGYTMYVSLEPCPMCASAIAQSRLERLVIAASSNNELESKISKELFENSKIQISKGLLKEESEELINMFFEEKRSSNVSRETL